MEQATTGFAGPEPILVNKTTMEDLLKFGQAEDGPTGPRDSPGPTGDDTIKDTSSAEDPKLMDDEDDEIPPPVESQSEADAEDDDPN